MGCNGCSVSKTDGKSKNNGCATGGCNRLNTFDWISTLDIEDPNALDIVEISFKNGARKAFFKQNASFHSDTGEMVVVKAETGLDVGRVSLSGELVRLQMKKKRVDQASISNFIMRKASEQDMERLSEARSLEKATMVRARVIARTLDLEMKIGDVEYQADKRKATFYYTADGRVDFRELIRHYAKEFKVKIEMRQIGARQESSRIGGLGSCGRELCCSTWLTNFKSVTTAAARYQNLAINQSKLSGQCGRLKCCLNYELNTYVDALKNFPKNSEKLHTELGAIVHVKTDIFKGVMYYTYEDNSIRSKLYALDVAFVKEIKEMNKRGEKPADLAEFGAISVSQEDDDIGYEDVIEEIELPPEKKKRRKSRGNRNRRQGQRPTNKDSKERKGGDGKDENRSAGSSRRKQRDNKKDGRKRRPDNRRRSDNKKRRSNNRPDKKDKS